MAPPKVHLNIKELGIPSLTTFVHKLANGVARSMVTTSRGEEVMIASRLLP